MSCFQHFEIGCELRGLKRNRTDNSIILTGCTFILFTGCPCNSRTPTTISRSDLRIKTFSWNDVIQNNTGVHVGLILKHDFTTHRFQQKLSCNINPVHGTDANVNGQ